LEGGAPSPPKTGVVKPSAVKSGADKPGADGAAPSSEFGTVWIDKAQTTGFCGVREDVWAFHIGGY
jgi:hypothetical protein